MLRLADRSLSFTSTPGKSTEEDLELLAVDIAQRKEMAAQLSIWAFQHVSVKNLSMNLVLDAGRKTCARIRTKSPGIYRAVLTELI